MKEIRGIHWIFMIIWLFRLAKQLAAQFSELTLDGNEDDGSEDDEANHEILLNTMFIIMIKGTQ